MAARFGTETMPVRYRLGRIRAAPAVHGRWRRASARKPCLSGIGTADPSAEGESTTWRSCPAELQRKREGKKTQTGMSEKELEKMASKPKKKS